MKPLYIAIIGFILVLILAAAAFYLLIHFDPSRIKTNISNRFEDMSGRKVKISGNLDISKTAISTAITLGKAIGGHCSSVRPAYWQLWSIWISVKTIRAFQR
jgi:uncharacterized protein involved in outer membrane biogenesis